MLFQSICAIRSILSEESHAAYDDTSAVTIPEVLSQQVNQRYRFLIFHSCEQFCNELSTTDCLKQLFTYGGYFTPDLLFFLIFADA